MIDKTERLDTLTKQLKEAKGSLELTSNELNNSQELVKKYSSKILKQDEKLTELNSSIQDKTEILKTLKRSLNSSESAAINFYINTIVSEISNDGIRKSVSNIYSDNSQKFNLRAELLNVVKRNKTDNYDEYSEKYYENVN